jgi:2-isopropylmalate synthase
MTSLENRKIIVFDTTLRDGEQSPGASMNSDDKLAITRELLRLNVDVIEAGFPASSPGDFQSVEAIAQTVGEQAVVCALARALPRDIETAAAALKGAARPRIQTGLGVSPQHLKGKLGLSEQAALEQAVSAVSFARNLCPDVQFYAEDAARADEEYLFRVLEAVIQAGASVINIPDTTGFSLPTDFGALIAAIRAQVRGIEKVTLSVHCHNDLGMATALTIAGLQNGAEQAECTINGIGERAGNAALEELVMALALHKEALHLHTGIDTRELLRASRLVSQITGIRVQPNKAIVGANAFAHSSGIHQDGVLKQRDTYEIIDPASVGIPASDIILSARSGRAALTKRLAELGILPEDQEQLEQIYKRFLELADRKREVYDEDLEALMAEQGRLLDALWTLESLQVSCGFPLIATATVVLKDKQGSKHQAACTGNGPIDAAYKALDAVIKLPVELQDFSIRSLTRGVDALGEVSVRVENESGMSFSGRSADGDIIVSSAKAYLNALNRVIRAQASLEHATHAQVSTHAQSSPEHATRAQASTQAQSSPEHAARPQSSPVRKESGSDLVDS